MYTTVEKPIIEELERKLGSSKEAQRYILAGKSIFTLRSHRTGKRYTYKVTKAERRLRSESPDVYFVSLLTGPDNVGDFTYLGIIGTGNQFSTTAKSKMTRDSEPVKAITFCMNWIKSHPEVHPELEIWHSGRCGRCGRRLTVPESIANGIGPECAGKMF